MNFYIYSPPCFYSSQDGPNSGCRDCLSCVLGPPWSRVRRGIFSWLQSATTLHTPNPPRRQESSPGLIPNISDSCQQWCLQMTQAVAPWNITACMRSNYFFSWNRWGQNKIHRFWRMFGSRELRTLRWSLPTASFDYPTSPQGRRGRESG